MLDIDKTKEQLISELQEARSELSTLKRRVTGLDARDVSTNEEISRNIAEIEDLYNNAPCGYHSLDPNGVFIRINDTELKWLGYTREEMIGRMNFADILTEESLIAFRENFPTFKASGWIKDLEFDLVTKGGSLMSVLLSATAVQDSDGNYLMSRSTLFDITHRKHLESELKLHHAYLEKLVEERTRELRQSETHYRELWGKAPVMMISSTPQATIEYISDHLCEELGYQREEVLGRRPFEFQTQESARFAKETIFPQFLQSGLIVNAPLQFVRKDGTVMDVLLNSTAERDLDGSIVRSLSVFTDVTSLKRTQQDLQQTVYALEETRKELEYSRNILRLFIDHSPVALAMFDREMRYIDVSPRWIQDYGLTREDIIGKSHYEIFPEITDRWKDVHQRSLNGEIVKSEEDSFERIDGSIQWVRWETRPWFTVDGNIGGIVIFTEDITERKVAEEELHLNELYLRSIFDAITEPVFLMRIDGIILIANQAVARMLGVGDSDLAGKCVYDYLPPDVLKRRRSWVKQVAQTGVPFKTEDVHDQFQVYHSIYPVYNEHGIVDRLAIYATDITDRVEMQKAVVEGEQRYRMIVETANEGIWTLDQDLRITFVNQRLALMLGYSIDEMPGMSFDSMIFDGDLEDHNRRMGLRRQGKSESYERRLKRKDGSLVWTIVNASPMMDRDGKFIGSFAMLTDITDRKKAEEGLRKNEQHLRLALEAARAGTWESDLQTNQNYWSDELFELYGLDPLVLNPSYNSWLLAIHPDDRSRVDAEVQDAVSKLQDTNIEWRVNLPDGEERWLMSKGRPVFDDNGLATSYAGVVMDITERKRSEIEIVRTYELLDTILNNIPVMVAYMDSEGKYQYVNRSWEQTMGWSMKEATTRDILPELSPDPNYRNQFRKYVIDSMTKSSGSWDDYEVITRDGLIIRTSWFSVPVASGNYVRLGLDITDKVKADHTRQLLASVVEHSTESIIITDADGTINYVNRAFEENTGYSFKESVGRNPRFLRSGEQDKTFYEDLWKTILAGRTWHGTLINRKKDGSLIQEESTIFPIKVEPGDSTNFVAIKRDITKESILRKQLLQAQKLEALGNLAGGIAHDFNNVIFGIMGYTDLAMNSIPKDSRAYVNLGRVMNAAARSASMVQQILAFSRQAATEKSGLDLRPLVKEGLKFLRAAIPSTIAIKSNVESGESKVMADPTQIHQVLMNLCVNASHAIGNDIGTILVDLSEVELDPEVAASNPSLTPGKYMRLKVTDTGSGIDPAHIIRIFDPYFTTKDLGKGTGLGLSVVYGIVKDHGGAIRVFSESSKGATFEVFLPLISSDASNKKEEPESPPEVVGKEHILIVDDEVFLLRMCEAGLTELGYTVTCCSDPTEALKLFQEKPEIFDVVISDYAMPGMTGSELTRQIAMIRPEIPIIICSGPMRVFRR